MTPKEVRPSPEKNKPDFSPVAAFHDCLKHLPNIPKKALTAQQRAFGIIKRVAVVITDGTPAEENQCEYHLFLRKRPPAITAMGDHGMIFSDWATVIYTYYGLHNPKHGYIDIDDQGRSHLICNSQIAQIMVANQLELAQLLNRYSLSSLNRQIWANSSSENNMTILTDFQHDQFEEPALQSAAWRAIITAYHLENDPLAQACLRQTGKLPSNHFLPPRHDGD